MTETNYDRYIFEQKVLPEVFYTAPGGFVGVMGEDGAGMIQQMIESFAEMSNTGTAYEELSGIDYELYEVGGAKIVKLIMPEPTAPLLSKFIFMCIKDQYASYFTYEAPHDYPSDKPFVVCSVTDGTHNYYGALHDESQLDEAIAETFLSAVENKKK